MDLIRFRDLLKSAEAFEIDGCIFTLAVPNEDYTEISFYRKEDDMYWGVNSIDLTDTNFLEAMVSEDGYTLNIQFTESHVLTFIFLTVTPIPLK